MQYSGDEGSGTWLPVASSVRREKDNIPMTDAERERVAMFYAETYDDSVQDWPGEIEYYTEATAQMRVSPASILELGCGTGRVLMRLAANAGSAVGLDSSPQMLEVARRKSTGLNNVRWIEGDMRAFDLGEEFGLVLIPGHAFQHLNTVDDQLRCLQCVRRHLLPNGRLLVHVDHQDITWLAGITGREPGQFEARGRFTRSQNGHEIQSYGAWSYEPCSQTAVSEARWEELDADGRVVDAWQTARVRLHCVFRFEMEHLLARAGFAVEALYGDFNRGPLADDSSDMIWVASRSAAPG